MRWTRPALTLLAICALVALVGPLLEARQRAPEQTVRAYLAAVERGDLDAALATIDPAERADVEERIALQLGNRYQIDALVLGQPSLLDRLRDRSVPPAWATLLADVTTVTGDRWKSTSTAPLVQRDDHWYLTEPPFA